MIDRFGFRRRHFRKPYIHWFINNKSIGTCLAKRDATDFISLIKTGNDLEETNEQKENSYNFFVGLSSLNIYVNGGRANRRADYQFG